MRRLRCCHPSNGAERHFRAVWSDFCAVAPSSELKERLKGELKKIRDAAGHEIAGNVALTRGPRRLGFDDGVIFPPTEFPPDTPIAVIRGAALERAPLRGNVNVIVVLVDFSDRAIDANAPQRFNELFFSSGVLPNGSVKEYYAEATGGLVSIVGQVVGPFRLPQTLAWYANNNFGIGRPTGTPRANIMANDAAVAADPTVNFAPFDNDGNGFIDAFIVVHAGSGGEQTGNAGDIWSHKWVLPAEYNTDGKKIFAYLTIPEDSRIGVCAHELGHLLFGFPDLYDTDDTSEGIGNWCLMAGGSWNGGGDVPAHPSAWCKVNQGWASVTNVTTNGVLSFPDVKTSLRVHRLWKNGGAGSEYFLVENRQRTGFDAQLPGDGLLAWHIDETQPTNTDENHYKVALLQADGKRDLELDRNRGDAGDPFPGSSGNTSLTVSTTPGTRSYAGQDTCVSIKNISASGPTMSATVTVSCGKTLTKEQKDFKEIRKERKELKEKESFKERKDIKDEREGKDPRKELKDRKDVREGKDPRKDAKDFREGGKGSKEFAEAPAVGPGADPLALAIADLEARVATLENLVSAGGPAEPFIGAELRPGLVGGPTYNEPAAALQDRMAGGDRDAKIIFDTPPAR